MENDVIIRPRHVYWDGDVLVAQCFVVNGRYTPVYNINVKELAFSNDEGLIASGVFGVMENAVIPARSHILWTFSFSSDAVLQANGALGHLITNNSLSYSH